MESVRVEKLHDYPCSLAYVKFLWEWGDKLIAQKANFMCVEHQSLGIVICVAIECVADNGVIDTLAMHANLVSATSGDDGLGLCLFANNA